MENTSIQLAALIARAWLDDDFKERLESEEHRAAAFEEFGLPDDPSIIVPPRPEGLEMSELFANAISSCLSECTNTLNLIKSKEVKIETDAAALNPAHIAYVRFSEPADLAIRKTSKA